MLKSAYWLIPIVLFILQAIYTFNTLNQIRYEELDESILNPYWVQNGYVQNGASSNLGWHFLMAGVYNVFGFDLFSGKFVRLAISFASLFCLAAVLKRYLGQKLAWLPMTMIGLSPTFLYFNTQQTVYGIDLAYFPICLFLATSLDFSGKKGNLFRAKNSGIYAGDEANFEARKREPRPLGSGNLLQSKGLVISILLFWFAMFAWMSYPSFVYFLPALLIFYLYKLRRTNYAKKWIFMVKNLTIAFVSFITPLALAFLWIKNRNLLIYDENVKSGMFRGAGMIDLDFGVFVANSKNNLINLFSRSFGYYFELNKVEFSDFYPIISLAFIFFAIYKLWMSKKNLRLYLVLVLSILFFNIIFSYLTVDPTPGLRRQTGILTAIYILFVFAWYFAANIKRKVFKRFYMVVLSFFLIHHVISYPINFLHLGDESQFREQVWFKDADDPRAVVDFYVGQVKNQNLELVCFDDAGKQINCRYNQIFAVVAGSCLWNRLTCRGIYGYDLKTEKYIPLTIELFNEYYFGRYGKEVIAT